MLWTTTWPPSSVVPTILVICAVLAWWFTEPKSTHLNLIVLLGCLLFYWAVAPELARETPFWILRNSVTLATLLRLDTLVLYHSSMLVTGAAVLWYVISIPRLSPYFVLICPFYVLCPLPSAVIT